MLKDQGVQDVVELERWMLAYGKSSAPNLPKIAAVYGTMVPTLKELKLGQPALTVGVAKVLAELFPQYKRVKDGLGLYTAEEVAKRKVAFNALGAIDTDYKIWCDLRAKFRKEWRASMSALRPPKAVKEAKATEEAAG